MWSSFRQHSDRYFACVLAISSLVLYVATLAPSVLMADGGEFQFAAPLAGIAHPTGYPLYLLLGWGWAQLMTLLVTPAKAMNLFSAFIAAVAIPLLYLTLHRILKLAGFAHRSWLSRAIAATSALLFAVSRAFWSQATIAEVYTLDALIVIALMYVLFGWLEHGLTWRDLIPLALILGLGLAHHLTVLLLAPALTLAVWLDERVARPPRLRWRHLPLLAGVMCVPLLLYLYIPLRAPHVDYLSVPLVEAQPLALYQNTLQGLVAHVTGSHFGGSIQFSMLGPARLAMAVDLLRLQFSWFGILLGIIGLAYLLAGRRWILACTTMTGYVTLVGFNLIYDIGDIAVFFIPAYAIWTLWVGIGLAGMCRLAGRILVRWKRAPTRNGMGGMRRRLPLRTEQIAGWFVLLATMLLPAILFFGNLQELDRHADWSAWRWWQRILAQPLPNGSVLVSNDRDEIMPLWYFQHIDGVRPDLIGLFPGIVGDDQWADIGMVIDRALESGRQVYTIKPMPGVEVKYDLEPASGDMYLIDGLVGERVAGRRADITLGERITLIGYAHTPYSVGPGEELAVTLHWQPSASVDRDLSSFVQLLDRSGTRVAGSDRRPGGDFYPTSVWKPGEMLHDTHRFAIPDDLDPGAYMLYIGLYEYPSLERFGDSKLGYIGVKTVIETNPFMPPALLEYRFEDKVLLWGYELRKEGQSILISLEWQTLAEMPYDYTTFIHLVSADGEIVSQADGQPVGGTYPTSIWDVDEVIIDAYRLPIETDMPAGAYRPLVGLYRLETGERLSITDSEGTAIGDFAELQRVEWP